MADAPSAYPLAWPPGRPRARRWRNEQFFTDAKGEKRHAVTIPGAIDRLDRNLNSLNARSRGLSSNLDSRLNGRQRADLAEPVDPGVALYFRFGDKPIAVACDRYRLGAQNVVAIAAHIDATRRIQRYGVATTEQMLTGFVALPAPMVVDDWRAALGNPTTLAEAEAAWKDRMRRAHSDTAGGSVAEAPRLNAAVEQARLELGRGRG